VFALLLTNLIVRGRQENASTAESLSKAAKNSIMSLKKKSKSLGHLTALNGVGPNGVGSPNFGSPRMKKHISVKNFNERLKFLNHSYGSSGNNNVGDSVDGATSPASEAMYHHHNRVQPQHPPPLQQPIRPHHAPPTRSTTALNLGTPIAQARADRAAADKAASASSAGKHTPKKLRGLVRQKTTNSMPNPMAMGRAFLARANNHLAMQARNLGNLSTFSFSFSTTQYSNSSYLASLLFVVTRTGWLSCKELGLLVKRTDIKSRRSQTCL
jgi:hypothetical protein